MKRKTKRVNEIGRLKQMNRDDVVCVCENEWFSTNDNFFIKRSRLYAKLSFVQLRILTAAHSSMSKDFQAYLAHHQIQLLHCAAEAHHQIGQVEVA